MPTNPGNCIFCQEDTGTGFLGSAHIVCRKISEGHDPMDIYHDMLNATMMSGQFEKELQRLFQRIAIRGPLLQRIAIRGPLAPEPTPPGIILP